MGLDDFTIWVFNGHRSTFPAGVFSDRDIAEDWIKKHGLTGTLTRYPVDVSAYDWAVDKGYFHAEREDQRDAAFIQRFTSASQDHYHYEDGQHG